MIEKRYLVSHANLFYTDEVFMSLESGSEPIRVFQSLEAAQQEQKRLQAAKVRQLIQTNSLGRYLAFGWISLEFEGSQEEYDLKFNSEFDRVLKQSLNEVPLDVNNDSHIHIYLNVLKNVCDLQCADFFYIYELDLE
jgi:hypothetical protein